MRTNLWLAKMRTRVAVPEYKNNANVSSWPRMVIPTPNTLLIQRGSQITEAAADAPKDHDVQNLAVEPSRNYMELPRLQANTNTN